MKVEKGKLKKVKSGYLVAVTRKKGSADKQIPESARRFQLADASDGLEVEVTCDDQDRIIKVVIPGKTEVSPKVTPPSRAGGPGKAGGGRPPGAVSRGREPSFSAQRSPGASAAIRKKVKAKPRVLGGPFHNPYTFLPFGKRARDRKPPTNWSADELETESGRLTGVLDLEVTAASPLLTCHPTPVEEVQGHKTFEVLRIGNDVIVPATGIRGALRTLLTVLTGGTLGYLNTTTILCQGRDAKLGPRDSKPENNSPANLRLPKRVFLAEVIELGNEFRPGRIRLGETRLVDMEALQQACQQSLREPLDRLRDQRKPVELWVGLDSHDSPTSVARMYSATTPWRLKLSGRPINRKGKREGVVRFEKSQEIELPASFWAEFAGRHAHGDHNELRKRDLVWVEPTDVEAEKITAAKDVRSLQWSRWGRRGQPLVDAVAKSATHVLPDYLQPDRLVDEVTDLFGQVSPERDTETIAFAGRVRPENLVFPDAVPRVMRRVTLAPLSQPHPGCIAFYRDNIEPDNIADSDPLRGYKVYRTTSERGEHAPWLYTNQGIYGDQGERKDSPQKLNKTCDLVPEGTTGTLRIAFRALSRRELALLLQACEVPWRLGGGKPLGLGLCRVRVTAAVDEDGENIDLGNWRDQVQDIRGRVEMWVASQQPVPRLRYPRAADRNNNKINRGGHTWFQRHAQIRKVDERNSDKREPGVQPLYVDGELLQGLTNQNIPLDSETPLVAGQVLPPFSPQAPLADVLFGYDLFNTVSRKEKRPDREIISVLEPFDPTNSSHVTGRESSGGNQSQNAETRREKRRERDQ